MSKFPFVALLSVILMAGSVGIAAEAVAKTSGPVTHQTTRGPVQLIATLDRTTVQIADPFVLTIVVKVPNDVTVTFPQPPSAWGVFNVMKVNDAFDIPVDNGRQWTRRYQLESLLAGKQTIPPIDIAFADRRNATPISDTISSPSLETTVVSVLEGQPDPLKFRDIKDVVELPVETKPSHAWIVWSVGGAAFLTLAGVGLLVWPQRDRQLSPLQRALFELDRLDQSDLVSSGKMQLFYCRLTDIVRQYIEGQLGIAAPKLTTPEFLNEATRHATLDQSQQTVLRSFLSLADLVKFARFEPASDDARQAITKARQFIEQSVVKPSAVEEKI